MKRFVIYIAVYYLLSVKNPHHDIDYLLMKEVIGYQELQSIREQELPQVIYNHVGISWLEVIWDLIVWSIPEAIK